MTHKQPNFLRVPSGRLNERNNSRTVYIDSRFIGGPWAAGGAKIVKTFSLSPLISFIPTPPNPEYHWCIIVGDFYHRLQATSLDGGDNYYDNDRWSHAGSWEKWKVETNTYNDISIQMAGERAISDMPETYHWRTNNCQSFGDKLLDLISPSRSKVTTTVAWSAIEAAPEVKLAEPAKLFYINPDTGEEVEVDPVTLEPIQNGVKISQPATEQPVEVIATKQAEEEKIQEVVANPEAESVNLAMLIMNENTPTITVEEMDELKKAEVPLVLPPAKEGDSSGVLIDGTTSLQPVWEPPS